MPSEPVPAQQVAVDSDSEGFDDDDDLEYMLGFAEEVSHPEDILRHHFPSKVGGRPAWLDPVNLPTKEQLTCKATGKPLNFLLQVYAPLDDESAREDVFHRAIFLFVTPQGDAITKPGAVRAFRCQLPRRNPFYSFDPPTDKDKQPPALKAEDREKSLRADPWQTVAHEGNPAPSSAAKPGVELRVYPEKELIVEPEERETQEEEEAMKKLMLDYEQKVAAEGELSEDELPPEVLDQVSENLSLEQKHFAMFQARMACAPEQCIRYCFRDGATPLWPSPSNLPAPANIPPCSRCGKPRKFEFQVLPQLLNHLGQDEMDPASLDWGTLVVYSCSASCSAPAAPAAPASSSAYMEEFVWVQAAS